MSLRQRNWPALALVLAFAASACSDATDSLIEAFDAESTSANLAAAEDAFESPALQSLEVFGPAFQAPGSAPAGAAAALLAPARNTSRPAFAAEVRSAARRMLDVLSGPQAVLIPDQYRGLTLVYAPGEGRYVVDETRAGPDNGIRFILYAVNPVSHEPVEPLQEIGHADVLDESTDASAVVRLIVVSEGVEFANYSVSASGPFNSPTLVIAGFVRHGDNRVDFNLSHHVEATFAGATVTVEYDLEVADRDFRVEARVVFDGNDQSHSMDINVTIRHGGHTISLVGRGENDIGSAEVRVDGRLFATIEFAPESVTVLNGNGEPLSPRERETLERILELVEDVFDVFEHLFHPVAWLFDVA